MESERVRDFCYSLLYVFVRFVRALLKCVTTKF